jgi:hypothetical protein
MLPLMQPCRSVVGLYSVLVDLLVTPTAPTSPRGLYVALAACHVIAMTSAVSNPIVYGWLNSNIRREFLQLLPARCACATHRRSSNERAKATAIGKWRGASRYALLVLVFLLLVLVAVAVQCSAVQLLFVRR